MNSENLRIIISAKPMDINIHERRLCAILIKRIASITGITCKIIDRMSQRYVNILWFFSIPYKISKKIDTF